MPSLASQVRFFGLLLQIKTKANNIGVVARLIHEKTLHWTSFVIEVSQHESFSSDQSWTIGTDQNDMYLGES